MAVNVLDIILTIVIIGVVVFEAFRGFGRAFFDGLGLYGALWLASAICAPVAASMHFDPSDAGNQGAVFALCFVVFSVIALFAARFVYGATLINLGMFEHLGGGVAGIAVALIVAHGIVQDLDVSVKGQKGPNLVATSSLGEQCLTFQEYHDFVDNLGTLTGGRRDVASN